MYQVFEHLCIPPFLRGEEVSALPFLAVHPVFRRTPVRLILGLRRMGKKGDVYDCLSRAGLG